MGKRELGFPRNLGDPVVSTEEIPAGATGQPTPGPTADARSRRRERIAARSRGIVRAKETKRVEKGGRKSECLDSTEETGELGPREPGGGKRGIEYMDSLLGHAPDTWRFDERIDETTTDTITITGVVYWWRSGSQRHDLGPISTRLNFP